MCMWHESAAFCGAKDIATCLLHVVNCGLFFKNYLGMEIGFGNPIPYFQNPYHQRFDKEYFRLRNTV